MLPGRDATGTPTCRDCAGITRSFFCDRCGFEGLLLGGRLCEHCTLSDKLAHLLDDGSGAIAAPLRPLATAVLSMDRPKLRLLWLRNPHLARLLQALATGRVPLTHEALHQQAPWRTAANLQMLLMDINVLPRENRHFLLYQRWLTARLATVEDPEHRQILNHFATWHQLRHLREMAERQQLGDSQTRKAKAEITQAGAFLAWLSSHGRTIKGCRQGDIDAWYTKNIATRRPAQTFIRWCMKSGRMPHLVLPPQTLYTHHPSLTEHGRWAMLRRILQDTTPPPHSRVAAALVLLYAQPVTRLTRLTLDDITTDQKTTYIRLGEPPCPLPEPIADLLHAYIHTLKDRGDENPQWLFPGRRPNQPMHPVSLQTRLRKIGVPPRLVRTAAIRRLLLQVPAPVIAKALGYHDQTTSRLAIETAATWSRYGPGDHSK